MGKFVLKRLLALIPTILIIVFVVYFILDLTPSDPGHLILGQMASEEAVAAKNAELGYDKPFTVRYAKYIWDLCHGSLGNSWLSGKGVFETVMARFPVTVTLAAGATLIGVVIGVALGVLAAMVAFARRVAHFTSVSVVEPGIYRVSGALFFVSSNDLIHQFDYAGDPADVVVDLSGTAVWDASSVATLDAIRTKYASRGKTVRFIGLDDASADRLNRLSGRLGV